MNEQPEKPEKSKPQQNGSQQNETPEQPKIRVDDDWKAQAEEEKRRLAEEVESVLDRASDAKDIRDLKPLEKTKSEIPRWWVFLSAGGLLLLGLLTCLFLPFREKRQ